MKSLMIAAAVAALVATPALAADAGNFTGVRVSGGATEGDRQSEVGYFGTFGVDGQVAPGVTLGGEVSAQDVFEREDISAAVRLGYAVTPNLLGFVSGGVADYRGEFGYRAGVGLELAVTPNVFTTVEYRYTDLGQEANRSQGLVGVGLRF